MTYARTLEALVARHLADEKAIRAAMAKAHRPYSLTGLINSCLQRPERDVPDHELELVAELNQQCRGYGAQAVNPDGTWVPLSVLAGVDLNHRDLTAGVSTAGGHLIGSTYGNLTELLRPVSVTAEAGATIVGGIRSGALILPGVSVGSAPGWTSSEGTTYADAPPEFAPPVKIESHTLSVQVSFSRQLLKTSSVAVEQVVRHELLAAVMAEVDRVALIGESSNDEPTGLLNTDDVPVVEGGANGAAPTWAHLVDLEHSVAKHARSDRAAFVTNADVQRKLRLTPRGTDLDVILPSDGRLLGRRLIVSGSVPGDLTKGEGSSLSAIACGDWSDMVICFWGPSAVDLLVNGITRAHEHKVIVTARCDVGIGLRRKKSFAIMRDAITTV